MHNISLLGQQEFTGPTAWQVSCYVIVHFSVSSLY